MDSIYFVLPQIRILYYYTIITEPEPIATIAGNFRAEVNVHSRLRGNDQLIFIPSYVAGPKVQAISLASRWHAVIVSVF